MTSQTPSTPFELQRQRDAQSDYDTECDGEGMYGCPACDDGPQYIINVIEGAPSMLGHGYDSETLDLGCGHRISFDPFNAREIVELTPHTVTLTPELPAHLVEYAHVCVAELSSASTDDVLDAICQLTDLQLVSKHETALRKLIEGLR